MSTVIVKIMEVLVKIINILTYPLKPKQNKVTYISYRDNKLPKDMLSISNELKNINPDVKEVYLAMKYKNTLVDKIKYGLEIIKQIYHIKTSKIVLLDGNNFVVSNINKKDTKIIQIWHATGAIKKFGHDYKRRYSIKNYDYVITASSTSIDNMAKAFNVDKNQIIPIGSSSTDELFNKNIMNNYKKEMLKKYPDIVGKKVILYAPTFRGEAVYSKEHLLIDLPKLAKSLGDEYVLLCKMHPIVSEANIGKEKNLYNVSNEELNKVFSITDILVSDFSAIIFDFSILQKPIVLYTPDLEQYKLERGLYYDYEDFAPGKIVYTELELINTIKNGEFDIEKVIKLRNEFFDYKDGKTSYRIAKFINDNLNIR